MARKPTITIVGPGSLGTAMAHSLSDAGYRISEIVLKRASRSARQARRLARSLGAAAVSSDQPDLSGQIVWICVPDSQIRDVALFLGRTGQWKNRIVLHSSGALTSDELRPLEQRGAATASVHPMMSFVPGVFPSLKDVPFAIEGNQAAVRVAQRVARDLGGHPFLLAKRDKAAYHAWGAFASPLLVSALATAEQVAHAAGISTRDSRSRIAPIVRQTIENYIERGGSAAFSGPIIRGDAATVRKHLKVLAGIPEAREVYVALARSALRYLPSRDRKLLASVLK
jgi:predicted short-subunit dehydrogenase-like oxidoreductase (DUF2520 family)